MRPIANHEKTCITDFPLFEVEIILVRNNPIHFPVITETLYICLMFLKVIFLILIVKFFQIVLVHYQVNVQIAAFKQLYDKFHLLLKAF